MEVDHLTLTVEWEALRATAQGRDLNREELQRIIELTRILRQTNTGPARKKKPAKGPISDDQLAALIKG